MSNFLDDIVAFKKREVEEHKKIQPLSKIINSRPPYAFRDFKAALADPDQVSIVAEIKNASPSKGILIENFDPVTLAEKFQQGGAAAISVLTDHKYFRGKGEYIGQVKDTVELPVLCKEFIIDPYQIYLARYWGADAVLLIGAILKGKTLFQFIKLARELNMAALVEVHNKKELQSALIFGADMIGVNNRDLQSFEVDFSTSEMLAAEIPDSIVKVAESGIFERKDIDRLRKAGYSNFLIGEAIVKADDIVSFIKGLRQ